MDTSQALALLAQIQEATDDISDGLAQAVEDVAIPNLQEVSAQEYEVVTGMYSLGWVVESAAGNVVVVTNTAEAISDGYPYSLSLEYGWRSHPGAFVGQTAAEESVEGIAEALLDWVMAQLPTM